MQSKYSPHVKFFYDVLRHRKVLNEYIPDPTAPRKKRSRKKNEKKLNRVPVRDINKTEADSAGIASQFHKFSSEAAGASTQALQKFSCLCLSLREFLKLFGFYSRSALVSLLFKSYCSFCRLSVLSMSTSVASFELISTIEQISSLPTFCKHMLVIHLYILCLVFSSVNSSRLCWTSLQEFQVEVVLIVKPCLIDFSFLLSI